MGYQFIAADLATGALVADLPLHDVRFERLLNGAGAFGARLKMPALAGPGDSNGRLLATLYKGAVDRARRVIYAVRDGVALGGWVIWPTGYDSGTQIVEVAGAELWSYWRRRFVGDHLSANQLAAPLRYDAVPTGLVVTALVQNPAIDIACSLQIATIAGTTTVEYQPLDAKPIADAVADLARPADGTGFDFMVDVVADTAGAFVRRFRAAPFLGRSLSMVAKYDANVESLTATAQGERRANWVLGSGAGDGAARAFAVASSSAFAPRLSHVLSLRDEISTSRLTSQAAAALRVLEHHEVIGAALVVDGVDAQLGAFEPGDVCRVIVEPGRDPWWPDGLDADQRIVGYQVDVPDTGGPETVALAFDDPAGTF